MWRARDSDFRDERQSRVYPRLAGCVDLENTERRGKAKADVIIPDLAELTDEEFQQRLINLRNEHRLTIELCDKLGLHAKEETNDLRNSLPVAMVDDEYTMSTATYADKSPVRSPDFVRKNFRATKSPSLTRRTKSADVSGHRQLQEAAKTWCYETDEKDMSEYKLKKYLDGLDYAKEVYSRNLTDKNGVPQHRCGHLIESMMESNKNMSKLKKSDWKHRVTIPKPFQMTMRDTNKGSTKTKAQVYLEREREERDQKEMEECQKTFKAAPVPANVYIPLYDELQKKKARQRSENHRVRQEFLMSDQNPFTFIDREKRKQMRRLEKMKMLEDADRKRPDADFQAKPFPKEIFSDAVYEKMRNEEEIRMLRMELRAEEMLRTSSLPKNMTKRRKNHTCEMSGECDHQHRRASDGELQATSDSDTDPQEKTNRQQTKGKYMRSRWPATHLGASPLSRSLTDLVDSSMPAADSTHWKTTRKGARVASAGGHRARVVSSISQQDPYGYDFDDSAIRDEVFRGYKEMNTGSRRYYDHDDHQMHSDYFDQSSQGRPEPLHHRIA